MMRAVLRSGNDVYVLCKLVCLSICERSLFFICARGTIAGADAAKRSRLTYGIVYSAMWLHVFVHTQRDTHTTLQFGRTVCMMHKCAIKRLFLSPGTRLCLWLMHANI